MGVVTLPYVSPRAEGNILAALPVACPTTPGSKGKTCTLGMEEGKETSLNSNAIWCACLFSQVLASDANTKIQMGSNTVLLDNLRKPKIYSQWLLYKSVILLTQAVI